MFMRRPPQAIRTVKDDERRVTCRYSAAKGPVVIGWWIGPEFETAEMALRDISLSGASAVTETPPPDSAPIWLRLNDPAHPDWVEATVIAVAAQRQGFVLVRIKFTEPCPYDFFKAAIRGIDLPGGAGGSVTAGQHRSHYWGGHYWD